MILSHLLAAAAWLRLFNLGEAVLWFVVAIGCCLWMKIHSCWSLRGFVFMLAWLTFGLSDLLETGVWWRPWWLLLLKTVCVLVFLEAYLVYRKNALHRDSPPTLEQASHSDSDPMSHLSEQ